MNNLYQEYRSLNLDFLHSHLLLDLDALDSNINYINQYAANKLVRVATKSIRSVAVLKYIASRLKNFYGYMTYSTEEALWLRSLGFENLLVGYPKWDNASLLELSKNSQHIILMVDSLEQLKFLSSYATLNNPFKLCLDIDLSLDLPFLRFGVFRSPLQQVDQLDEIVHFLNENPALQLMSFMGYEAQIAGVGDKKQWLIQLLKKISIKKLRSRRINFFNYLKEKNIPLNIVNGGGSGSLKSTTLEPIITEITIGSAFYSPTLFDEYVEVQFKPALFYSLPIIRQPKDNIYTCFGGGYIASGAIGPNKVPVPFLPINSHLLQHEGAGEVQTPIMVKEKLKLYDPIFFRYAKAGELCERFNHITAFRKTQIESKYETYRGEGKVFI